jgi:hypothetical protein
MLAALALAGAPAPAAADVKIIIGGGRPHAHPPGHHPPRFIGGRPVVVWPQPVYIAPRRCQAPGYWTQQWVPQTQIYYVWAPGQYNSDALWIEGHYEPRAYQTGYWQPLWVDARWADC